MDAQGPSKAVTVVKDWDEDGLCGDGNGVVLYVINCIEIGREEEVEQMQESRASSN